MLVADLQQQLAAGKESAARHLAEASSLQQQLAELQEELRVAKAQQ